VVGVTALATSNRLLHRDLVAERADQLVAARAHAAEFHRARSARIASTRSLLVA